MMKKLLSLICLILTASIAAQTETINIDWGFGSNPSVSASAANYTNRTIEVGDTVTWNWVNDGGSHNVVSSTGSTEAFSSGSTTDATNHTFSFTFTMEGTNPFVCQPHAGNMNGTITVVAEGALSTPEFEEAIKFDIVPNPSKSWLNIKLSSFDEDLNVEVFDVLGKRIHKGMINQLNASVNVSAWKSGIYLVRVSNDKITQTKRFIKQ